MSNSQFGFLMCNMFVAANGNLVVNLILCLYWLTYGILSQKSESGGLK